MPFTITRADTASGGALALVSTDPDGAGEMTFSNAGTTRRIVDHTHVDDSLRGLGAGEALAERMVEDARKDDVKLVPLCPFFLATAKKHPEWHDAVAMPGG